MEKRVLTINKKSRKSSKSPKKSRKHRSSYSRSYSRSRSPRKMSRKSSKKNKRKYSNSRSRSKSQDRSKINSQSPSQKRSKRTSKFSSIQNDSMMINPERQNMINPERQSQINQTQNNFIQPSQVPSQQQQQVGGSLRTSEQHLQSLIPQKNIMQNIAAQQQITVNVQGQKVIPFALHKHYKHALRIYVGNIPDNCDKDHIQQFISQSLRKSGGILEPVAQDPVFSTILNQQKMYVFFQMRSIEEATALLQLDGILYLNKSLRIRRTSDYDKGEKVVGQRPIPTLDLTQIQMQKINTQVENSVNKVMVQNIPEGIDDQVLIDMLQQFGQLKSFHQALDKVTCVSKGFAFCEYMNPDVTDIAIQGLHGKPLGNKILSVIRSQNIQDQGQIQIDFLVNSFIKNYSTQYMNQNSIQQQQIQQPQLQKQSSTIYNYDNLYTEQQQIEKNIQTSAILRINNIINKEEIEEDKEYEFVYNNIQKELQKIGAINQIIIPRIKDGQDEVSGIGKIYIEYIDQNHAQIAKFAIESQQIEYEGKKPQIDYYDARKFADQIYI